MLSVYLNLWYYNIRMNIQNFMNKNVIIRNLTGENAEKNYYIMGREEFSNGTKN